MDDYPGGLACRDWYLRIPLTEQWTETSADFRECVLAFWIRASESDAWTYSQLQVLMQNFLDTNEDSPSALQTWANNIAADRIKPRFAEDRKVTRRVTSEHS